MHTTLPLSIGQGDMRPQYLLAEQGGWRERKLEAWILLLWQLAIENRKPRQC
jgi:hypothetical protein